MALLLFLLVRLLFLRFSVGDVYPPYSTLRSDPLGARALHDALKHLPGLRVERDMRPPSEFHSDDGPAVFVLSVPPDIGVGRESLDCLESTLRAGGCVFLSMTPKKERRRPPRKAEKKPKEEEEEGKSDSEKKSEDVCCDKKTSTGDSTDDATNARPQCGPGGCVTKPLRLHEQWGFSVKLHAGRVKDLDQGVVLKRRLPDGPLPEAMTCHTRLRFAGVELPWRTVYGDRDGAVLMERPFATGRIVLAAESYPFSNQALRDDPQPGLVSWIVGDRKRVVFDESHLGVTERSGVMTLLRRYRLGGVYVALLVLGVLIIWRGSTSFLPRHNEQEEARAGQVATGRDAATGLVNLLHRSIPRGELPKQCVRLLQQTPAAKRHDFQDKLQPVRKRLQEEQQRPLRKRDVLACYNDIRKELERKE